MESNVLRSTGASSRPGQREMARWANGRREAVPAASAGEFHAGDAADAAAVRAGQVGWTTALHHRCWLISAFEGPTVCTLLGFI